MLPEPTPSLRLWAPHQARPRPGCANISSGFSINPQYRNFLLGCEPELSTWLRHPIPPPDEILIDWRNVKSTIGSVSCPTQGTRRYNTGLYQGGKCRSHTERAEETSRGDGRNAGSHSKHEMAEEIIDCPFRPRSPEVFHSVEAHSLHDLSTREIHDSHRMGCGARHRARNSVWVPQSRMPS